MNNNANFVQFLSSCLTRFSQTRYGGIGVFRDFHIGTFCDSNLWHGLPCLYVIAKMECDSFCHLMSHFVPMVGPHPLSPPLPRLWRDFQHSMERGTGGEVKQKRGLLYSIPYFFNLRYKVRLSMPKIEAALFLCPPVFLSIILIYSFSIVSRDLPSSPAFLMRASSGN